MKIDCEIYIYYLYHLRYVLEIIKQFQIINILVNIKRIELGLIINASKIGYIEWLNIKIKKCIYLIFIIKCKIKILNIKFIQCVQDN